MNTISNIAGCPALFGGGGGGPLPPKPTPPTAPAPVTPAPVTPAPVTLPDTGGVTGKSGKPIPFPPGGGGRGGRGSFEF